MAEICRTFKWEVFEMLRLTVHTKGLEEIKDKLMQASSNCESLSNLAKILDFQ